MTRDDLGARFELLFARRFRYLRVSRFLTQKEVASAIACNVLTYAGYEHGKSFPRLLTLIRLAELYAVTLDDLLCRDEILIEMEHEV